MLLQRFKWALCVSVPIWFGYGFARDPDNLEWVKRVVGAQYALPACLKGASSFHVLSWSHKAAMQAVLA